MKKIIAILFFVLCFITAAFADDTQKEQSRIYYYPPAVSQAVVDADGQSLGIAQGFGKDSSGTPYIDIYNSTLRAHLLINLNDGSMIKGMIYFSPDCNGTMYVSVENQYFMLEWAGSYYIGDDVEPVLRKFSYAGSGIDSNCEFQAMGPVDQYAVPATKWNKKFPFNLPVKLPLERR